MTEQRRPVAARAFVIGALASLAGAGVAELLTGLTRTRLSPILAIGESVIELTPGAVAERAIDAVGRLDKPLLVVGVVIGTILLGGAAGVLIARHRAAGVVAYIALAVVPLAAVLTEPGGSSGSAVIVVLSAVVTVVIAVAMLSSTRYESVGRRTFLRDVAILGTATVVVGGIGRWMGAAFSAVEDARDKLKLPVGKAATPEGVAVGVDGVESWRTSPGDFYRIDTTLAPPLIKPEDWELRIHGMVDHELTLTYDDLVDRGLEQSWVTLCCVSNEVGGDLISNTVWGGVPIKDVLDEVGVHPDADALLSTSDDGWNCGTPLAALTDGRDALLAVTMDGEPLPVEHGFPVRMVVPGLYGYVSATKWVVEWEVTRFADFEAYWTERGWAPEGPVKTQSRIDTPHDGDQVPSGRVAIGGVAWAQHRGIEAVEVRVDDGDWEPAELARVPNVDTWVQWKWEWDAEAGDHDIAVRATDRDGDVQTSRTRGTVPDGATGHHTVTVTVT
ncbi:molybdopterin-dependent oxidoreductase [Solicola gregarius]|uniref:Molybdopterin-dependent oxidoreductase n=1 Tax=Solicola gregarius TaxID=2908642 RepID=A0AA46YLP1_9ACTN|nr:molybdopterin-dependent oxidoreductase [Solicola gregarius]UYM06852.1 molybdopterin-dependent oxidoreductase [Solicola gregarius]